MITQKSILGFTPWTVDAITWTPITLQFPPHTYSEARIENTGAVTVNLRTLDTDSVHERALLSGEGLDFRTDTPRNQNFTGEAPICYAKAASATSILMVIEK